jgi:hypothetical protein
MDEGPLVADDLSTFTSEGDLVDLTIMFFDGLYLKISLKHKYRNVATVVANMSVPTIPNELMIFMVFSNNPGCLKSREGPF